MQVLANRINTPLSMGKRRGGVFLTRRLHLSINLYFVYISTLHVHLNPKFPNLIEAQPVCVAQPK